MSKEMAPTTTELIAWIAEWILQWTPDVEAIALVAHRIDGANVYFGATRKGSTDAAEGFLDNIGVLMASFGIHGAQTFFRSEDPPPEGGQPCDSDDSPPDAGK